MVTRGQVWGCPLRVFFTAAVGKCDRCLRNGQPVAEVVIRSRPSKDVPRLDLVLCHRCWVVIWMAAMSAALQAVAAVWPDNEDELLDELDDEP